MGYTHSWNNSRALTDSEWDAITTMARRVLRVAQEDLGIALSLEYDVNRIPVVSETEIRFNGYEEEGHETFVITREPEEFAFCKTARKPYDPVVVAILQGVRVYADSFRWLSDGSHEDLADGVSLYNTATGAHWGHSNATSQEHRQ